MLTLKDVAELIQLTFDDMPPELKKLYDEEVLLMEKEMLTDQKTLCVIRHDNNKLPILKYLDEQQFLALSLSGGIIVWLYRGMSMLIPAARIANLANTMEAYNKLSGTKSAAPKTFFTTADVIMLPEKIADALLGENI